MMVKHGMHKFLAGPALLFGVLLTGALLFGAAMPAWAGGGFVSVYEDLPLAPGLAEVPGSALSFDSADGRIVEADARGRADTAAVLKFYHSTLPQLGWTEDGPGRFHRDQDSLRIDVTGQGAEATAHFTISPK